MAEGTACPLRRRLKEDGGHLAEQDYMSVKEQYHDHTHCLRFHNTGLI